MKIETLDRTDMELVMNLMLETRQSNLPIGCPVTYDNGKVWTLTNFAEGNVHSYEWGKIKSFQLLYYDESNPSQQSRLKLDREGDSRRVPH